MSFSESPGRTVDRQAARTSPWTYAKLASFAFALLGLELVLVAAGPLIPLPEGSIQSAMVHWALTIILWVGGAAVLAVWAIRHTGFTLRSPAGPNINATRWTGIVVLVAVTLAGQVLLRGGVIAPVAEYDALTNRFGDEGQLAWLVQVAYYVAELCVMVLIIGFGQLAGDLRYGRRWVPWGGIALATTWGLVHFLTQNSATGIYGIGLALVMGIIYVLAGRSIRLTFPILLILFII